VARPGAVAWAGWCWPASDGVRKSAHRATSKAARASTRGSSGAWSTGLPDAPADPLGGCGLVDDAEVVEELLGGDHPEVGLAQRPASLAVGKQVGGDELVEAAAYVDQHVGQHRKRLAKHGRAHSRPPARRDQAGMLALVGGGEQQDLEGLQALAEQPG
jgi:hypothetical protein